VVVPAAQCSRRVGACVIVMNRFYYEFAIGMHSPMLHVLGASNGEPSIGKPVALSIHQFFASIQYLPAKLGCKCSPSYFTRKN
jgi:hypothetical protein